MGAGGRLRVSPRIHDRWPPLRGGVGAGGHPSGFLALGYFALLCVVYALRKFDVWAGGALVGVAVELGGRFGSAEVDVDEASEHVVVDRDAVFVHGVMGEVGAVVKS